MGNLRNNEVSYNEIWIKSNKNGCGAGILITEVPDSFRIERNNICENSVKNGKGWGGGINISVTGSYMNNNIIEANSATNGGGILVADDCSAKIINNNIIKNNATSGGGIYLASTSSTIDLMNSIVWGNQAATNPAIHISEGSIQVDYSDIQGGWSGAGNINDDPKLTGPDCYLSEDSPCIDEGNPDAAYNDPEDTNNPGYALFPSRGTVRNDIGAYGGPGAGETIMAIKHERSNIEAQPNTFTLFQNYPNPFNPVTVIRYQIQQSCKVDLNIFNILGQKVSTLVSRYQPAGFHQVEWDATGMPSGVYFCTLSTGHGFTQTRKLVLLR